MADELPPDTPEVTDPILIADLIRLLSVKGALGRMPLADVVVPVVSLGDVVVPSINVRAPSFRAGDVFSAGHQTNAAANFVHADTTALPAGVYDVVIVISSSTGTGVWNVEHRDAANAANLALWPIMMPGGAATAAVCLNQPFSYELAVDERLRILSTIGFGVGERSAAYIFARIR